MNARGNEQTANDVVCEKAATLDDVTSPDMGVGGGHMDTDERAAPMRELPEKLVAIYDIVSTEKEAEKLPVNELQECPENLWRRVAEAEAALNAERMAHAETRLKFKELIVAKEDGVSPKDVSQSPVIEVGGERDTSIISSAAASMTELREVKSTADRGVELEVKSKLDNDVSQSPVIEVGGERDTSIISSAAASMTELREVKSTADRGVELEVQDQLDKDVSHSPVIEVGGERDTSIISSASASMTEFREVKSTADRVELEVKSQLDNDVSHSPVIEVGGERYEH